MSTLSAACCAAVFVTRGFYLVEQLRLPALMVFDMFQAIRPLMIIVYIQMFVVAAILIKWEHFGENMFKTNWWGEPTTNYEDK